ncbi:MAG: NERD domain-containing protein [Flavobacteriaceae bacterium]|nr:NERD domain-containing protein [Candidatus Onthonaster equi]
MLLSCFSILFIILIITYYKYIIPSIKGRKGERIIACKLAKLDERKYEVFNDVKFNIKGKQSQIDHIVISDYGIFVIETKNYQGTITGSEKSENWTQSFPKSKYNFYNPIRQNLGHIYALNYVLKDVSIDYHSIVAFTDKSKLKVKTSTDVVQPQQLLKTIKKYKHHSIDKHQKELIKSRIQKYNVN